MIIQALILFLMNENIDKESENISRVEVPNLNLSQEMTLKVQELQNSLLLYLIGNYEQKDEFEIGFKDLRSVFDSFMKINPDEDVTNELKILIKEFHSECYNKIFNIYDPKSDQNFKLKVDSILMGSIIEVKNILDETKIKYSEKKTSTETLSIFNDIQEDLEQIGSDVELYHFGHIDAKEEFKTHSREFSANLKRLSSKGFKTSFIDSVEKSFSKLNSSCIDFFSAFDPSPKFSALSSMESIQQEISKPLVSKLKEISYVNSVLVEESVANLQEQISTNLFVQIIAFSFGILVVAFVTFFTYRKISKPISELNWMLYEIAGNNVFEDVRYLDRNDEIGKMARAIQKLKDITTARNLAEIEIFQAKKVIEEKGIELEVMNEDLVAQREEIYSAIRYAKRIQNALLPTRVAISEKLKDYFLIYKPKDIVSGDFYWVEEKDGTTFIAVADCTGHGVPGSMLTMMGIMLIEEAILQFGLEKPNLILSYVNNKMRYRLSQYDEAKHFYDGMDVAMITIDKSGEMTFSGAGRPLYHIRNGELQRIRGDKYSIGNRQIGGDYIFNSVEVDVKKGDRIILSSDGFVDQVGHNGKKFGTKGLRILLQDNHDLSSDKLEKLLLEKLKDYMGNEEQRDDIAMLGLKF